MSNLRVFSLVTTLSLSLSQDVAAACHAENLTIDAVNLLALSSPEKFEANKGNPLPFVPAMPSAFLEASRIPRKLLFTYKFNLLNATDGDLNMQETHMSQNVRDTISLFAHDIAPEDVHFWDDSNCLLAMKELGHKIFKKRRNVLVKDFNLETFGAVKADLCRLVMLYKLGGYYFDADIVPLPALKKHLLPNATFITVKAAGSGKDCLFQAFLAATPKHPVILRSIQGFVEFYEELEALPREKKRELQGKTCRGNIGTGLLRKAFDEWSKDGSDNLMVLHGKRHVSQFFQEKLDISIKDYTGVPTHLSGGFCDYSVVDQPSKSVVMFSRVYDWRTQRFCVQEAQMAGGRQASFVHIGHKYRLMCYD